MPKASVMSHHRRRLIIAPESPPATPPTEGAAWSAHNHRHHNHTSQRPYNPSGPRAIVQRSSFAIEHPSHVARGSNRHAPRNSGTQHADGPGHRSSTPSSASGTPVFKFDEDLNGAFRAPRSTHHQHRRHGKLRGIRRSESMDSFPGEEDPYHGRISESEPAKGSSAAMALMMNSGNHNAGSSSRRSLDIPRPSGRRTQHATSAPIKIPSREKQEAERKKRAAAAAKAAAAANSSHRLRPPFRSRRSIHAEPKYGLNYSSSEESLEELATKRR